MARQVKPINRGHIPPPPFAQQQAIAAQTEAFLAKGGEIQHIPNGVSGQVLTGGPRSAAPKSPSAKA